MGINQICNQPKEDGVTITKMWYDSSYFTHLTSIIYELYCLIYNLYWLHNWHEKTTHDINYKPLKTSTFFLFYINNQYILFY